MAVNDPSNAYTFVEAGDTVTGPLNIRGIQVKTAAVASVSTGTVILLKDGSGEALVSIPLAAESSFYMGFGGPSGWTVNGLELDAIPTGATMTVFLA